MHDFSSHDMARVFLLQVEIQALQAANTRALSLAAEDHALYAA